MPMAFCRGCGKEIHESAPTCPHCGATQAVPSSTESKWMAITASALGALVFLASISFSGQDKPSTDEIVGAFIFAIPSIVLAAISLNHRRWGKPWAITAIVLSALGILITAGT